MGNSLNPITYELSSKIHKIFSIHEVAETFRKFETSSEMAKNMDSYAYSDFLRTL